MFDLGRPLSTSHLMTASTVSGRVWISGGPTGFTLMPTTSFGSMRSLKLSFMFLPVRVVRPFSNISAMTFPSNFSPTTLPSACSSTSDRASVTLTTLPGKGPGSDRGVRGTLVKSAMLVSTGAGAAWPKAGPARTSPPAVAADAAPSVLTNSRRLTGEPNSIER